MTVSQLSCGTTVHAQPGAVVTVTDPVAPLDAAFAFAGSIVNPHGVGVGVGVGGGGSGVGVGVGGFGVGCGGTGVGGGTADCSIVAVTSPIVTFPTRAAPAFTATVTVIAPARVPVAFGGIMIHGESLAADHEHPVSVSILIDTAPPLADTVVFNGATVKRQGAASCSSSTCVLLTSIVARRWAGFGFAVIRYAILPSPCPFLVAVRLIQSEVVAADHVQSRAVVTESVPSIPADGAAAESEFATLTSHFGEVGEVSEMLEDARPHATTINDSPSAANSRARIARVQTASVLPYACVWKRLSSFLLMGSGSDRDAFQAARAM